MQKAISIFKTYVPMIVVGLIVLYIWTKWFAPCSCAKGSGEGSEVTDPGIGNSQANDLANTAGSQIYNGAAK